MSGTSYGSKCPNCGEEMGCYHDWKPFDTTSGQCNNCGFGYYTEIYYLNLEEVNSLREELCLEPLEELPEQKFR